MKKEVIRKNCETLGRVIALTLILSLCCSLVSIKSIHALVEAAETQATIEMGETARLSPESTGISNEGLANATTPHAPVQPNFSSPLPLIILDSSEAESQPSQDNSYSLDLEVLSSNGNTANSISSATRVSSGATLHNMTDRTNSTDRKHDYFVRFDNEVELLDLPSTREYFILGAMDDKSLIRNYVGYSLAQEVFADSPEIKLCELILRDGEGDQYQGVYLLVAWPPAPERVLFHRSTQGTGSTLETYADHHDNTIGELTIPFRDMSVWDKRYDEALGKLSWAEEVLYDTTSNIFYEYQEMIDVESFISGFIVGELVGNFDGMHNLYFYFDGATGLISYAPLWNFQHALDNDPRNPVTPDTINFPEATYFRQLFKSPSFATQIQTDYLQLRRVALDEGALMKLVDEAAALVSSVQERDWERWNDYQHVQLQPLTEVEIDGDTTEIEPFSRETDSFESEILRVKTQLRERSLHLAINVTQFDFQEQEISKEIVLSTNPIWMIIFVVAFFVIVHLVRRYGV